MSGKRASIAAGVVGLLTVGGVSAATVSAANAAPTPRWQVIKSVRGQAAGEFSAVVATGKQTGWAFQWPSSNTPSAAFERNGGTWTKEPFPGLRAEPIVAAGATSPSNVWVISQLPEAHGTGARVLHFNGHTWSCARQFGQPADGLTVRSATDVWLFSHAGVWHYDGHAWTNVGGDADGGSVVSDQNVWAFRGTNVYHWNGHKWAATSLSGVLPAKLKSGLNDPAVAGILALSASSVYATGNGDAEDQGGPIAVLHYDGHTWKRVAEGGYGQAAEMSPDGHGGLWIPMPAGDGETSKMLHYAGGKLTVNALPGNTWVAAISRVPGTAEQLAVGLVPHGVNSASAAVILQYS